MSEYHYWTFFRRTICVASVFLTFATVCTSASAIERTESVASTVSSVNDEAVTSAITQAAPASQAAQGDAVSKTAGIRDLMENLRRRNALLSPYISSLQQSARRIFGDPEATPSLTAIEPAAGEAQPQADEPAYDLILQVRRRGAVIAPIIVGLQKGDTNYVPLLEVGRAMQFIFEGDAIGGTASGYFINPQNSFSLNAREGIFTVRGESFAIPQGGVLLTQTEKGIADIFVTLDVLNTLWPLDAVLNFSDLALDITSRTKFASDLERERKKRQEKLEQKEKEQDTVDPAYDYVPNDYNLVGRHTFNLTDSIGWSGQDSRFFNNFIFAGRGDLLGATADYSANITNDSDDAVNVENVRFRMTREDHGTGALPLGLKLIQTGDISARSGPLVEKMLSGRGIYISSDTSGSRNQSFDEITVEGTGTPGWEVEVYRGNELIDYGVIDETGRYAFDSVPLSFGKNEIRTVLYGPHGEVEERSSEYQIKNSMLRPGEVTFDAGAMDYRQPVIETQDDGGLGVAVEGLATTAKARLGINHWLTAFTSLTRLPVRVPNPNPGFGPNKGPSAFVVDKTYATVGGDLAVLGGIGQAEVYHDVTDGGNALDVRFARNFAGIRTTLRGAYYNDFESREAGFGTRAKTFEGEVRANKAFDTKFGQLGLSVSSLYKKFKNDSSTLQLGSQQYASFGNRRITNIINSYLTDGNHTTTDGEISIDMPVAPRTNLRAALEYDVYPKLELDLARMDLRYDGREGFTAGLNVSQGIRDSTQTRVGVNTSYDFGSFIGGADAGWSRDGDVDFMLRASTVLGPNGENNEYNFTSGTKATYGTGLKVRLFHDIDGNGTFTPGDEPVSNTKILISGRRSLRSDAEGYIDVPNAGPPGLITITLDSESADDPFLVTRRDGHQTVLRAGTKPYVEMPLILSGGIDGTAYAPDGTRLAGVTIQLVDQGGRIVAKTTTSFDGFYSFERVRPGTYTVQVDPALKVFVPPKTVLVTSEDLFAYGVDLGLLEQAAEVPAAEGSDGDRGRIALFHAPVAGGSEKQPAPSSNDGKFSAVVNQVRIGEHPYEIRLVLDLSAPATFNIQQEDDGSAVVIDLPDVAWNADKNWSGTNLPIIKAYETEALPEGGTRLRIYAKNRMGVFYKALLPPNGAKGYRLYIDLAEKKGN